MLARITGTQKMTKKQEVLKPVPRGYLRDWNHKIEAMPTKGAFEVLRIQEVHRLDDESLMVVEPITGRVFRPFAWRRKKAHSR